MAEIYGKLTLREPAVARRVPNASSNVPRDVAIPSDVSVNLNIVHMQTIAGTEGIRSELLRQGTVNQVTAIKQRKYVVHCFIGRETTQLDYLQQRDTLERMLDALVRTRLTNPDGSTVERTHPPRLTLQIIDTQFSADVTVDIWSRSEGVIQKSGVTDYKITFAERNEPVYTNFALTRVAIDTQLTVFDVLQGVINDVSDFLDLEVTFIDDITRFVNYASNLLDSIIDPFTNIQRDIIADITRLGRRA